MPPRGAGLVDETVDSSPELLQELFGEGLRSNVRWGLERTRAMLAAVGYPHRTFRSLHVGGTNGKGSVAAILDSVLRAHGHRVGLYTSPHLCRFNERIRIDGKVVTDERLRAIAIELRSAVSELGPSYFEVATALAFAAFARSEAEVVVAEVGLGGRLDSTNVLTPDVSVITNVALDHVSYLGESLEEIAAEKAGIIKPGVPVLTADSDAGVLRLLRSVAGARQTELTVVGPDDLALLGAGPLGTEFQMETASWGRLRLRLPLLGRHQALNAALAVRTLEKLGPPLRPSVDAVVQGVARVTWPGRLQRTEVDGVDWLFDVAHNPAGVRALGAALDELDLPRPITAVVGILVDKDARAMLEALMPHVDGAVMTAAVSAAPSRRWDPVAAGRWARSRFPTKDIRVRQDLDRALAEAIAGRPGCVVVTGSSYTVGDVMLALEIPPD